MCQLAAEGEEGSARKHAEAARLSQPCATGGSVLILQEYGPETQGIPSHQIHNFWTLLGKAPDMC